MLLKNSLIFFIVLFIQKVGVALPVRAFSCSLSAAGDTVFIRSSESDSYRLNNYRAEPETLDRPSPLLHVFRHKQKKNRKVVATLLAFPFPFGIVGLHRIYLGCAPYVPVAYIGSLGGVFGILPFIDFCVLLLDKDVDRYLNNKKIFMWIN
jgi:TM2 domain-containing membrane protein YozV